jgi:hypothetical protein
VNEEWRPALEQVADTCTARGLRPRRHRDRSRRNGTPIRVEARARRELAGHRGSRARPS